MRIASQSGIGVLETACFILLVSGAVFGCRAISPDVPKKNIVNSTMDDEKNTYVTKQAGAMLNTADEALERVPPQLPEPVERKLALLILDGVLHEDLAASRPPVQEFLHKRISRAVADMEHRRVDEGAQIWKLYNDGFVIRTATVTMGFDLVRGAYLDEGRFAIEDAVMQRLVDQCDVLFISHQHQDHADPWVARLFLKQGKPVIAPPDFWEKEDMYGAIVHPVRDPNHIQTIAVKGGKCRLEVVTYPGDHGLANIVNNVYLVSTPEDLCFCHTGDQNCEASFAWIDEVKHNHKVDVLMPNCWTMDIARMISGFDPQLVITGHENEMGHTVDHREPYWLSYERKTGSAQVGGGKGEGYPQPSVLMTWGESYHYTSRKQLGK
jgi:L-ascorbate metabolism protein UlaG (beta-lactamase superfamily)